MPKRNQNKTLEETPVIDDVQDDSRGGGTAVLRRMPVWAYTVIGVFVLVVVVIGGFELTYMGKIYPGVSIDGVYVGGLNQSQAVARVEARVAAYSGGYVPVTNGSTVIQVPLGGISLKYNADQSARAANDFGRTGNMLGQLHEQVRSLFDRPTSFTAYTYSDNALTAYILRIDNSIDTPDKDATLSFNGTEATANASLTGTRLDLGLLTQDLQNRLADTSQTNVPAPVYQQAPAVTTAAVEASISQIAEYIAHPVALTYLGQSQTISQSTIISWIQVTNHAVPPFLQSLNLADIYPPAATASLSLDQDAIAAYVSNLAQRIDQNPLNATVSYTNGNLSVVSPSQSGLSLDQQGAVNGIMNALTNPSSDRTVALNMTTSTANVTSTNLASLGITTLLASGQTYFPGSPSGRLQNVRAGAARYNNLLISPGEVFDFGAQLGEVDASTGYVPELVIEGNHEEFQYGGGLCQVCTTAFRAALLAGLPIDERENHSFAISYYQWPYSAPGVDATIFYPQVDLKFTNNTGHYILIQTIMSGDHLTFNYYGTKVESGVIRGPYFVTGSNNAAQASHTVFYRDVLNAAGQVTKTDTFNSYYQPSTDFPIEGTVN